MTQKPKNDLIITEQDKIVLKEYEGSISCREDLVDMIHFIRQQTAQEIFKDIEKDMTIFFLVDMKRYQEIKQKYLGEKL